MGIALRLVCMTTQEALLIELIDQLQTAVDQLRDAAQRGADEPADREAVEAFAEESFRARDA